MGMANYEDSAPGVILMATEPRAGMALPSSLYYHGESDVPGVEKIEADDAIRQIITPRLLLDVVEDPDAKHEGMILTRYARPAILPEKVGEVYPVDGMHAYNRTHITAMETEQGTGRVTKLLARYDADADPSTDDEFNIIYTWRDLGEQGRGWRMDRGMSANLDVRDAESCKAILVTSMKDGSARKTIDTIDPATQQIVKTEMKHFRDYRWAEEIVRLEVMPGPAGEDVTPRVVEYGYYDDASRDGDNYSRVRWKKEGDGDWEHYRYNKYGWTIETIRRFGNNALDLTDMDALRAANRVERHDDFDIDLDDVALGEGDGRPDGVERMQRIVRGEVGQARYEIDWSRSYPRGTADPEVFEFWEIDCRPGDPEVGLSTTGFLNKLLGSPDHLGHRVVKTRRFVEGHPREFDLAAVEHGDGRITIYEYPDEGMTVVTHGEANASGDCVVSGTRVTRRADMNGRELFEVIERKEAGGSWQTESGQGIQ